MGAGKPRGVSGDKRRLAGLALLRRTAAVLCANSFDLADLYYKMSSERKEVPLSAREARERWKLFLRRRAAAYAGHFVNLYVSVPFCSTRCDFCEFYNKTGASPEEVKDYLKATAEELRYFGGAFRGLKVRHLFIGGTPSYPDASGLSALLDGIFSSFSFAEDGQKVMECAPSTMSREKIDIARAHGLNKITMGVQTLDEKVSAAINRPQKTGAAIEFMDRIGSAGFAFGMNVDLIMGLHGESAAGFLRSFSRTLGRGPETVTVYGLSPTAIYVKKFYGGDTAAIYRHLEKFRGKTEKRMLELAEAGGYVLLRRVQTREWLFCRKDKAAKYFEYYTYSSGFSQASFSTLGIGSGARSVLYGDFGYAQSLRVPRRFDSGSKMFSGGAIDLRDEMLKHLFVSFRSGAPVMIAQFRQSFGLDPLAEFSDPLRELAALGYVEAGGGYIRLLRNTPEDCLFCGLVLVGLGRFLREILPAFPEHIAGRLLPKAG